MPRPCTVCNSVARSEIEAALAANEPCRRVAQRFAISSSAAFRHKGHLRRSTMSGADGSGNHARDSQARIEGHPRDQPHPAVDQDKRLSVHELGHPSPCRECGYSLWRQRTDATLVCGVCHPLRPPR